MKQTFYRTLSDLKKHHRTALHLVLEGHVQQCVAQTVGLNRVTIARLAKSRAGTKFLSRVREQRLWQAVKLMGTLDDDATPPLYPDYFERGVRVFGERSRVQIAAPEPHCRCKGYHGMRAAVLAEVRGRAVYSADTGSSSNSS